MSGTLIKQQNFQRYFGQKSFLHISSNFILIAARISHLTPWLSGDLTTVSN